MTAPNETLQRTTGGAMQRGFNTGLASANSSADPNYITQMLKEAAAEFHVITPATRCPTMPDGCEIMMSAVLVDSNPKNGEVYPITGSKKLGLGKVPLEKIASAYGISWDPRQSHREDDASCPDYCEYTAVGHYFDFDGREQTIFGTKSIDLRRGAAMWEDAHERARLKAIDKATEQNDNVALNADQERRAIEAGYQSAEKELRHARIHILALAQSKARLRAIRSIGIKSSYTEEELKKAFVAAKIIFTGHSDNPANEAIYAQARAEHFLGSSRRMYGSEPAQITAGSNPPPPVPTRNYQPDDYIDAADFDTDPPQVTGNPGTEATATAAPAETAATAAEPPKTESQPATQAAATTQAPPPAADTSEAEGFTCRFGNKNMKGKKLIDITNRDIEWLANALADSIADEDKARYLDSNKRDLRIVQREVARRENAGIKANTATGRSATAKPAATASTPQASGGEATTRRMFD